MKKLLLAVLFLGGMTAQANTVTDLDLSIEKGKRYNQPQSITFTERGVEFEVFINGQFDFARTGERFQIRNQGRRGFTNNAPGHTYAVSFPYRGNSFVTYNRRGDIYQVGRNVINYNRKGKVNQIGTIALRYKNGKLARVGDMHVIYNRKGRIIKLSRFTRGNNAHYKVNKIKVNTKNNKRLRG